ncbi:MAG: polyphenol oxidase family protein [Acidobacteria bacterium]|nr:polyphenol oxidase family protein [Acidobacteriota bacterium]
MTVTRRLLRWTRTAASFQRETAAASPGIVPLAQQADAWEQPLYRGPMWRETQIGPEIALVREVDGARLMFGQGPRHLGAPYGERAANILRALSPVAGGLRWGEQIHGRVIASLSPEPGGTLSGVACVGRCDGLVTDEAGLGVIVWTADCVPLLIAGGDVVAAVHVGWRGAAAGIVPTAVHRLEVEYGVAPQDLLVALGPAVGLCHYEVGPEVVRALEECGVPTNQWCSGGRVDLRRLAAGQLVGAGVEAGRIECVGGCTACEPDLASYRRDGVAAGRQWSLAVLRR